MPSTPDPDMPVDEIMRRWPATIRVMIRHGMLCIGCPFGIFHTVADAAAAHEVDEAAFTAELSRVIRPDSSDETPSAFEEETAPPGRNL
ncbi:MAG: DUF1858 domain-containing protein [Hoeflea sp.]|nr:DUF1858 domain-containing protein [Hoeflea sp.]MBC7281608.1 DUF1858 domain-containing protein [Hoeflea sp.]